MPPTASRERDKPFFAWVHFYDPHAPYDPPEEFREGVPSAYDGEIAFVDSQIQRLLSWLDENGLREQTLIIVVGDHGEGLQDHDEDAHGHFVYNSTVRVPLIVHFPARIDRPRTVSAPVQLVDLFPTVVELLDWKSPELALDGRSLAGALEKGEAPAESVYGESEYPLLGFGWAPLRYSVVDRWKYIDAPRAELYDLQADPDERTNVIEDHADVAEQMRSDLAELVSYLRENRPDVGSTTPDQETIERLASLGYVATTATPDDFDDDAERRDPKDMRYVVRGFEEGLSLHRRGDYQGAVEVLAPLVEQSPESGQLSALLGMSYVHLGRNAEAQRALEASIEQNPNNRRRWFALGVAHKNQNHLEDALACFKQAIALSPGWAQAQREAATALSMMHRMREAEPYWRSCVELDPSSAQCLTNLASMRLMARQPREAVPLLERALAVEPRNENTHRVLWKALMGSGRRTDALRALEKANELFPAVRAFSCPLAWYRATTPQTPRDELDRAIEWAKACCEAAPGNARNFDVLAAAYAASGDFRRAVETAQHAMQLVAGSGPENLRRAIEARLQLYRSGRPYVEAAPPAGNGGPSN
jgi:choline-sulfatase